jgi:hypothetical protein
LAAAALFSWADDLEDLVLEGGRVLSRLYVELVVAFVQGEPPLRMRRGVLIGGFGFAPVTLGVGLEVAAEHSLGRIAVAPRVLLDPPDASLRCIEAEPVDHELADLRIVGVLRCVLVLGRLVNLYGPVSSGRIG